MAEEIHDLDYWRKFFRCASPDIFHVIYQGIRVAAADSPAEFRLRRDRIAEMLFSPHPPVPSPRDEPARKRPPEKTEDLDFVGGEKQIKAGSNGVSPDAGGAVIDHPPEEETWSQIVNEIANIADTLRPDEAPMRVKKGPRKDPSAGKEETKQQETSPPLNTKMEEHRKEKTTDDAEEMAVREKIEASKRKLHAGYEKASHAKKMRTVCVVPLKDAPKPGPDPRSSRRWR